MTSPIHHVRVSALSDIAEYSYATAAEPGCTLIFLAGACPLDRAGRTVGAGDVVLQAKTCVDNLKLALEACGGSFADLVHTRVLVATTSQEALVAAWTAYRDALAPFTPPSTLMGVTVLGYADQLVEIEAVAAIPPKPSGT